MSEWIDFLGTHFNIEAYWWIIFGSFLLAVTSFVFLRTTIRGWHAFVGRFMAASAAGYAALFRRAERQYNMTDAPATYYPSRRVDYLSKIPIVFIIVLGVVVTLTVLSGAGAIFVALNSSEPIPEAHKIVLNMLETGWKTGFAALTGLIAGKAL